MQYSAFGAAVTEVELDMLTGERRVVATDIAYDCGYSLNPRIDLGQVEGAFVMGEEGGAVTGPEGFFSITYDSLHRTGMQPFKNYW